jgi:uncharacterized protein YecE (DUF72 family)
MKRLFVGASGYSYKDWKGKFYPEKLPQKQWLQYYSEYFSTVEINNSFYTLVKEETYRNWYSVTPAEFRFAVKGNRYITQFKKLKDVGESLRNVLDPLVALREKLSVVLWQFPASFVLSEKYYDEYLTRLEEFLELLPRDDVRHAFEFRDIRWFGEDVAGILRRYNAAYVLSDTPVFPCREVLSADFVYVRFHGPGALYATAYSDKELSHWAEKIKIYLQDRDVYGYFNNDMSAHAIKNAKTLQSMVS